MNKVGYYYPPDEPLTDWDRYYNGFERWLNDNYDLETKLVFGYTLDEAYESEELLRDYIEWVNDYV